MVSPSVIRKSSNACDWLYCVKEACWWCLIILKSICVFHQSIFRFRSKNLLTTKLNVSIRRSYLCLFTSYFDSHRFCLQRFASDEYESMVIDIDRFSVCFNRLSLGYFTLFNHNCWHLSSFS